MIQREPTQFGVLQVVTYDDSVSISLFLPNALRPCAVANSDCIDAVTDKIDRAWWIGRVLVTNESSRGKGLGSLILERLLAHVSRSSCRMAVVAPGGYGADLERQKRFYQRAGFKEDEDGVFVWTPPKHSGRG